MKAKDMFSFFLRNLKFSKPFSQQNIQTHEDTKARKFSKRNVNQFKFKIVIRFVLTEFDVRHQFQKVYRSKSPKAFYQIEKWYSR